MDYHHTQSGYMAWLIVLILVVGLVVFVAGSDESSGAMVGIAILLLILGAVGVLFTRLTVTVGAERMGTAFGWGWPRHSIDIADITAIGQVRNKWYYGWGIRKIPGGWMYNVWGLDAVELELASRKKFRVGTDEPSELLGVLSLRTGLPPRTEI